MDMLNYRKDETLTLKQHFNLCKLNFQPSKDIPFITTPHVFSCARPNGLPDQMMALHFMEEKSIEDYLIPNYCSRVAVNHGYA